MTDTIVNISPKEKGMLRIKGSTVVQNLALVAKPICFPDFSGDGYLDLVVWSDEGILTEVVVYIDRDTEFGSLSVSDMHLYRSCDLLGREVEGSIEDLKVKVLDLMDKHEVYSVYLEEISNKMGTYEPTGYT